MLRRDLKGSLAGAVAGVEAAVVLACQSLVGIVFLKPGGGIVFLKPGRVGGIVFITPHLLLLSPLFYHHS